MWTLLIYYEKKFWPWLKIIAGAKYKEKRIKTRERSKRLIEHGKVKKKKQFAQLPENRVNQGFGNIVWRERHKIEPDNRF